MITFIIGVLVGLIPTFYLLFNNNSNKKVNEEYLRRGIYNLSFNCTRGNWQGSVNIQYEVGEIESADDVSKIEVISLIADQSRFNTVEEKKTFIGQINHSWIDSSKIKWLSTKSSEREKKINQILNG
jgi:hypothetical protein